MFGRITFSSKRDLNYEGRRIVHRSNGKYVYYDYDYKWSPLSIVFYGDQDRDDRAVGIEYNGVMEFYESYNNKREYNDIKSWLLNNNEWLHLHDEIRRVWPYNYMKKSISGPITVRKSRKKRRRT